MTTTRPTDPQEWTVRLNEATRGTLPGELGIETLHAEPGEARARMRITPRHLHPGGFVHSAATACLGDATAACATIPLLGEGEGFSTIEFKSNFFRPVREGVLICEAAAVHRGQRTIVLRADVVDHEGRPVALMVVTQQVLEVPTDG